MSEIQDTPPLSFRRMDLERKLACPAGSFTQPGPVLPAILAIVLALAFYGVVFAAGDTWFGRTFTEHSWVPYVIVAFSAWALMLLFVKGRKIALQRKALRYDLWPDNSEFILSTQTVSRVLNRLYEITDRPNDFLLFNRIQFALYNLRHLGNVSEVGDMLRSRAENDEAAVESSYTVVRGLIWAIPVLGFIGTVIGLSEAISNFSQVLQGTDKMSDIKSALQDVTGGLGTAFETTLQALVAALIIQLIMTGVKRTEERMLDEFTEYCERQVVTRLRLHESESTQADYATATTR